MTSRYKSTCDSSKAIRRKNPPPTLHNSTLKCPEFSIDAVTVHTVARVLYDTDNVEMYTTLTSSIQNANNAIYFTHSNDQRNVDKCSKNLNECAKFFNDTVPKLIAGQPLAKLPDVSRITIDFPSALQNPAVPEDWSIMFYVALITPDLSVVFKPSFIAPIANMSYNAIKSACRTNMHELVNSDDPICLKYLEDYEKWKQKRETYGILHCMCKKNIEALNEIMAYVASFEHDNDTKIYAYDCVVNHGYDFNRFEAFRSGEWERLPPKKLKREYERLLKERERIVQLNKPVTDDIRWLLYEFWTPLYKKYGAPPKAPEKPTVFHSTKSLFVKDKTKLMDEYEGALETLIHYDWKHPNEFEPPLRTDLVGQRALSIITQNFFFGHPEIITQLSETFDPSIFSRGPVAIKHPNYETMYAEFMTAVSQTYGNSGFATIIELNVFMLGYDAFSELPLTQEVPLSRHDVIIDILQGLAWYTKNSTTEKRPIEIRYPSARQRKCIPDEVLTCETDYPANFNPSEIHNMVEGVFSICVKDAVFGKSFPSSVKASYLNAIRTLSSDAINGVIRRCERIMPTGSDISDLKKYFPECY